MHAWRALCWSHDCLRAWLCAWLRVWCHSLGHPASYPLAPGTVVKNISIASANDSGRSPFSAGIKEASTTLPELPQAPTQCRVIQVAPHTVRIAWQPLSRREGEPDVIEYEVGYTTHAPTASRDDPTADWFFGDSGAGAGAGAGAGDDDGAGAGAGAGDGAGAGAGAGDGEDATNPLPTPRGIPHVIRTNSTEPWFEIGSGAGSPASDPLIPGTRLSDVYVCAVVPHIGAGKRGAVASGGGDITTPVFSEAPAELQVTDTTHHTIALAWKAPQDTGGQPITCYRVYATVNQAIHCMQTVDDGTAFTLGESECIPEQHHLPPGTFVSDISVAAVTPAGEGPRCAPLEPVATDGDRDDVVDHTDRHKSAAKPVEPMETVAAPVPVSWPGDEALSWLLRHPDGRTIHINEGSNPIGRITFKAMDNKADKRISRKHVVAHATTKPGRLTVRPVGKKAIAVRLPPPGGFTKAAEEPGRKPWYDPDVPTVVVEPGVIQQVVPGAWVFFLSQDSHFAFEVLANKLGAPKPPTHLLVDGGATTTEVPLVWTPPAHHKDAAPILEYIVSYRVNAEAVTVVHTDSIEPRFAIGSGDGEPPSEPLPAECIVSDIRVAAVNSVGISDPTPPIEPVKVAHNAATPTGLKVVDVTDTTVTLAWDLPDDHTVDAYVAAYCTHTPSMHHTRQRHGIL